MRYQGKILRIKIEGKSHSDRISFELDGIRDGHEISLEKMDEFIQRRSAKGKDYATARKESDRLELTQGLDGSLTTGDIIKGQFKNEDTRSKDYSIFKKIPRPSHIDYAAINKYGEDFDLAGSGEFSGRLTVALVAIGALCVQVLEQKGIYLGSHFKSIYNLSDQAFDPVNINKEFLQGLDRNLPFIDKSLEEELVQVIEQVKSEEDSIGGVVELAIIGDIDKLGSSYFDRFQAELSKMLMSIPGTKGIEFGNGFEASKLKGSENNDAWELKDGQIVSKTNRAGGINGGITNGMPIILRLAFKPTSSISKAQKTLNIESGQEEDLVIEGRHDPAFVLRTPAVVEAMAAISILDMVYAQEEKTIRDQIDKLDNDLVELYLERIKLTDQVGVQKLELSQNVDVPEREKAIIERLEKRHPSKKKEINELYKSIFQESKRRQENIIKRAKISYGLIGRTLGYSYSKEIHERMADYFYELVELEPDEVGDFLNKDGLKGLNVTIPYKKEVIPYLDVMTREARRVGVVNTIKFQDGKKIGFNTDFYGFKMLLINKKIFVKGKNALILGTGATSKTVEAVLRNMGAGKIVFVSRTGPVNYDNLYEQGEFQVLVNTTPYGMQGEEKTLVDLKRIKGLESVVDVIYNPIYSRLVAEAKALGLQVSGGLDMLFYQAKKAVEIFTDTKIFYPQALEMRNELFNSKLNLVLVGMPGCGKSTIGRHLSKRLDKIHVDLDEEFFKTYGVRPAKILEEHGEDRFRQMESEVCKAIGKRTNLVISTGGGVVTRLENYYPLKQNAVIFLVERDVRKLSTRNRPLSQGGIGQLFRLKDKRQDAYEHFADYSIINNGYFRFAVEEIEKKYWEILGEL